MLLVLRQNATQRRRLRAGSVCLLSLWLLAFASWAHAASSSTSIEIRTPYVASVADVYVLNAQLLFTAPDAVERAVREGAILNMELQIRITRSRSWWRDEVLAQLQQRYTLLYHGVSERYLVRNMNSGAQTSYPSFAQAIESLQRVDNLPILDQALLVPDARNEINLRASVEVRSIPRVLGMLLFWVDNFALESDWYTWPLKP